MYLTRHLTAHGARWAVDNHFLAHQFELGMLMELPQSRIADVLQALRTDTNAEGDLLPPIEHEQEIWASGVTYMRSREARMHESETKDIYDKVYEAVRPELFFKALGWRTAGPGQPIRIRVDSRWNVPEPELTLVINSQAEIIGYTAGNDVSSRDIEGENPLYLPQAKVYNGSAAIGPGIVIASADEMTDLPIQLEIRRAGKAVFQGETNTGQIKRPLQELADYLLKELHFPQGVLLLTGAGIVPPDDFTLQPGDSVHISVADLQLENPVHA